MFNLGILLNPGWKT